MKNTHCTKHHCDRVGHCDGRCGINHEDRWCEVCNLPVAPDLMAALERSLGSPAADDSPEDGELPWYTDHDPGPYCDRVHPLVDHDTWHG